MLNVTIGADPEFFLKNKQGKFISAHDIVPGTKQNPHPLKRGGFIQADGTAVEFNIQPAKTAKEFSTFIGEALEDIREFVPKDYEYVFKPSVKYCKTEFDRIPDDSKALGCDPDFNAYSKTQNAIYQPPDRVRTGSGHLHIGFTHDEDTKDPEFLESCRTLVQYLDATLASQEHKWCKDEVRPTLYGKLGNFRPKPYGVEYRTLGNAWLNNGPEFWKELFATTKLTVEKLYDMQENAKLRDTRVIAYLNAKTYSYENKVYSNNQFTNLGIKPMVLNSK